MLIYLVYIVYNTILPSYNKKSKKKNNLVKKRKKDIFCILLECW